jgi:hypothetical protein
MGYDRGFTANMARLHALLFPRPETRVLIMAQPDRLCSACPHLLPEEGGGAGCGLGGKEHEVHMRAQDGDVAARLGIVAGDVLTWQEILGRIAAHIAPRDLPAICTTCPWLPEGVCEEGIAALADTKGSGGRNGSGAPRKEVP